jgi:hypothetical protein
MAVLNKFIVLNSSSMFCGYMVSVPFDEELEYFNICLFGKAEEIDILTKKFSLWR